MDTKKSDSVDQGWSWLILFSVSCLNAMTYGLQYISGLFFNAWLVEFPGSKRSTAAWITSLPMFILCFAAPVFPIACRHFKSIRWVSMGFTIFVPVSLLVSAFVTRIEQLIFTFGILMGIGFISWAAIFILLVQYFDKYLGIAVAVATSCGYVSTFFLAPLCDYLIKSYGWRNTLMILSGIVVVVCIPCVMLFKDHVNDTHNTTSSKEFVTLLKSKRFWLIALSFGILAAEYLTFATHMVQFAVERKFASIGKIRTLPIYNSLGNIAGRITITPLVGCVSRKQLAYKLVLVLTAVCALTGLAVTRLRHLVVFEVFYGILEGGSKALFTIIIVELVGKKSFAEASTLINTLMSFYVVAGPVIVGAVVDVTGSYNFMFYLLALIPLLSAVLLNFVDCFEMETAREEYLPLLSEEDDKMEK